MAGPCFDHIQREIVCGFTCHRGCRMALFPQKARRTSQVAVILAQALEGLHRSCTTDDLFIYTRRHCFEASWGRCLGGAVLHLRDAPAKAPACPSRRARHSGVVCRCPRALSLAPGGGGALHPLIVLSLSDSGTRPRSALCALFGHRPRVRMRNGRGG